MSQNYSYPYYPYSGAAPRQSNPYQSYGGYPYQGQQQPQQNAMQQAGQQPPAMSTTPYTGPQVPGMLPVEQSYIENILRLNKGKIVTAYFTFENSDQWRSKVFKGVIEAAGRDHLILSDPQSGTRYLLPLLFMDYATFDEELEYEYPFGAPGGNMVTYSPR
ncbi:hypothetical protein GCM10008967_33110 [Bacillus carboniphilus]|uniref:Spore coat protein GerQ n=1 Tax=Bacillus carboniphilus TaxID=86663 RepID=A0ABP3G9J5_9BACI